MGEVARAGSAGGGGGDPFLSGERRPELRGGVDVWIAPVDVVLDPAEADGCKEVVTPAELAGCDRFRFDADRRRELATRALARIVLSRYAEVAPGEWRFETGQFGRPEIASPAGTRLRFNLAHTRDLVACAVTETADVGVDVERVARLQKLSMLVATVMSDAEADDFRPAPEPERAGLFITAWTLKEAYLKARGLGLTLSPRAASFALDASGAIRVTFSAEAADDPAAWWFASWDEPPEHVVAVALRTGGAPSRVQIRRLVSFDGRADAAGRLLRRSR